MPNFVDLSTGGWGGPIQDPLNSGQTPTMANFATLADALAGCATRVTPIACEMLFQAAKSPKGDAPSDTLTAAETIARAPWYLPGRVFALLDSFYPVPIGKNLRPVPFMPYLNTAPSAWVLPLKFDGGGYRAGGKAGFDSEGNLWVGDNFTIGWQASDALWQGHATKFAPNGRPLSPITTGFTGGGMEGGTFGAGDRRQRQRLAHQLRQQVDHRLRQDRQAADAARRHHLRRPARADAGRHRHAERRRVGSGRREEPARLLSRRAT